MSALTSIDAVPVWADASGEVVVIKPGSAGSLIRLYRSGAIFCQWIRATGGVSTVSGSRSLAHRNEG